MGKPKIEFNHCVQYFEKDGTKMYAYVMAANEKAAKKKANKELKPFGLKAVNAYKVK